MSISFTFALAIFFEVCFKTGRVVITLYALQLGAQPFTVGALAAMLSVLPTLLSWYTGRLADRFGSRWLLLLGTAAGFAGMLAVYLRPGIPALFVTAVMYGLLSSLSAAPVQNLVGLQSTPQDRARNFSNLSIIFSFGGFAGPLLAGFSFDHAGPGAACLSLALLTILPALMLGIWGGILPTGSRTTEPAGSIRALLAESGLWRVMATSSLVMTGVDLFQVFLPIYGHGIGLSASLIGIILAVCASASFGVRFFLPFLVKRFTAERVLACAFLLGAAGFLLVPFFESIEFLSLISFFFGLGMGCGAPITLMMTYSNSTQGRSGEALGLRVTANFLARAVAQVLFGALGSVCGVFVVFWLNALMLVSGTAVSHKKN